MPNLPPKPVFKDNEAQTESSSDNKIEKTTWETKLLIANEFAKIRAKGDEFIYLATMNKFLKDQKKEELNIEICHDDDEETVAESVVEQETVKESEVTEEEKDITVEEQIESEEEQEDIEEEQEVTEDEQEETDEEQEETEEHEEEPTTKVITAAEVNQLPTVYDTPRATRTRSRAPSPEQPAFPPHPRINHYGSTDSLPIIKDMEILDRHNTIITRSKQFHKVLKQKHRELRQRKEEIKKQEEKKKAANKRKTTQRKKKEEATPNNEISVRDIIRIISP